MMGDRRSSDMSRRSSRGSIFSQKKMKFGKNQPKKETDPEKMTKEELIEYMLKKKAALK